MSGIGSSASSSSSSGSNVYGNNVAPISFPGIASGVDYNSIIQKYTALTLQQQTPLQNKVTALNNQQAELFKIQDLLAKFQDTFKAVSDPNAFTATTPTSSNSAALSASTISGSTATPGSYVITSATLATATQIQNSAAANGPYDPSVTLNQAGGAITPSNGGGGTGTVTIDGVQIQYNATGDTLNSFIATANSKLPAGASLSYDAASGKVTVTSTQPLTLGSGADKGNLLQALKLDTAQITYSGGVYTATSSGPIGGINYGSTLNQNNNAGFATAVTAGTFTINGVAFTVDPTKNNLKNILDQINGSSAGVLATYDQAGGGVILSAKTSGPQGIALGSTADSSNFLQAAGFLQNATTPGTLAGGASESVGKSALVQYLDNSGTARTAYSNTNTVTNAIPGVRLSLQQAVAASAPVTVTVGTDSSALQNAITTFAKAYNAVIDEINTATQAPVIGSTSSQKTGQQISGQISNGGVLFNNQNILSLKDRLVNLATSFGNTGSSSYNSLASVGLKLDNSFTVASASSGTGSTNSTSQTSVQQQTFQGTSGRFADLNVDALTAALAANPNAVSKLFTGAQSVIGNLGAYLTTATFLPTQLASGSVGKVPAHSLFSTFTKETSDQIASLQTQIQLVTDQANLQADRLRKSFTSAESLIAKLQQQQSALSGITSLK
ncbi:MAG: flagellar hook-associated protein 2 [Candidatus Eremiobacteraeota bacterium]|nr:flagellar hook-associated protein 2 [Candidatus Eremiobacteraeota bacterium]